MDVGPIHNDDVFFGPTHRAILYKYDASGTPRHVMKSSAFYAKRNSSGWYVDFSPRDFSRKATTIPTGTYCGEIEFRFKPGSNSEHDYADPTYITYTDQESINSVAGVFNYYQGSGFREADGVDFKSATGNNQALCPLRVPNPVN